jgi:hypothetical protein
MVESFVVVASAVGIFGLISVVTWLFITLHAARKRQAGIMEARHMFRRRREWLEAEFVTIASERRKPRDLVWADCEFDNDVAFARDRDTGQLRALVGVTISFEAEEGGSMEDVEAVCSLRAATAVFSYRKGAWTTEGRAVFNLNPEQTIRRYQHELEVLD